MATPMDLLFRDQRNYFEHGHTQDLKVRKKHLEKLGQLLSRHEGQILAALKSDLRKSSFESQATELFPVKEEIHFTRKHLNKWTKPKRFRLKRGLVGLPVRVMPEPLGHVLILSPWNYPFNLSLTPLVSAVAAGNVVTLKPSEWAARSAQVLADIIHDNFPRELISVIMGDATVAASLTRHAFDSIFFTGSPQVGKKVMAAASENLTPVTLELGGKSPAIVDKNADLEVAAQRLMWGKFTNAGQTCVAPDYVLVHEQVYTEFLALCASVLEEFYGGNPYDNPDYGSIVNAAHYDRLLGLMSSGRCFTGGKAQAQKDRLYIPPTLMTDVSIDSPIMKEEIFGPLLPFLPFSSLRESIQLIKHNPHPLALYVFSKDSSFTNTIVNEVPFGGGCINDTLLQTASPEMPFGGRGTSGFGAYHGYEGFKCFTHFKTIVNSPTWIDPSLRYPPYADKLPWLKRLMF
ncbi:MAG: aldehyde dehydrogenase family protein [Pseudobdellovibrionaceae bacterium]|nr:aldehyde dehydrogenase family protein [Bdellovibrionales bacterium]USN48789.1 MAG: aldehyde dehydrogenase family protein [Pseudobdellovibrionaceae bacterium]